MGDNKLFNAIKLISKMIVCFTIIGGFTWRVWLFAGAQAKSQIDILIEDNETVQTIARQTEQLAKSDSTQTIIMQKILDKLNETPQDSIQ